MPDELLCCSVYVSPMCKFILILNPLPPEKTTLFLLLIILNLKVSLQSDLFFFIDLHWLSDSPTTSLLFMRQNSYWFLVFYALFKSIKIWTPNQSDCPYFFVLIIRKETPVHNLIPKRKCWVHNLYHCLLPQWNRTYFYLNFHYWNMCYYSQV